jgi:hypothetical protein
MKSSKALEMSPEEQNRQILRDKLLHDPKKKKKTLADFYGKLSGTFGDGLAYQKNVRNEWR